VSPASSGRWWTSSRLHDAALLLLCSAYLLGGLAKLSDFAAAQAEMAHFGLAPAGAFAAASIATELIAPALVLSGRLRWLGALWLAGFTFNAMLIANRFWEQPPGARMAMANGFFEHVGLVGAFLVVAIDDLRRRAGRA